jgi:hypothetical protein
VAVRFSLDTEFLALLFELALLRLQFGEATLKHLREASSSLSLSLFDVFRNFLKFDIVLSSFGLTLRGRYTAELILSARIWLVLVILLCGIK